MKNGDFSNGETDWIKAVTSPGAATITFAQNKAVVNITNVGDQDWSVQLKQEGIKLEKGCTYRMKFKAKSTKARTIKCDLMNASYDWYGGADLPLREDTEEAIEFEFTVDKDTDSNIGLSISMGIIENVATPASEITLSDFELVKLA